jgi:F420-0:gamma-glutamyl ligase-like protein
MKFLIALLLAVSTTSHADDPTPQQYVDYYIQDAGVVHQILGAASYYTKRCGPLTSQGEYYKQIAMSMHNIDSVTAKHNQLYQQGFFIATTYSSCSALWDGMNELGLGFLFEK